MGGMQLPKSPEDSGSGQAASSFLAYLELEVNSDKLIDCLEAASDLIYIEDPQDARVYSIRRWFEKAQDGPAAKIIELHPCEKCKKFEDEDNYTLNGHIMEISFSIDKIEKPIRFLKASNDPNVATIKEELDKILEASKKIRALARKQLNKTKYEEVRILLKSRGLMTHV